jgi:feruloyl esterase
VVTVRGFLEAIVNRSAWKSSGLAAWKEPVGNIRVSAAVLLVCVGLGVARAAAATCEDLASLKLPDTTITLAQSVAAGAFTPPPGPFNVPIVFPFKSMPAFCRVAGVIRPTSDSNIQFEVWMPSAGWNGKLQGIGNGGFAGTVPYNFLSLPLARGYAVATTDTGHVGGDASWALGHPEKVVDFGYRAIHETAVKAKAILRAFYGASPQRSYFSSCSNGGRQALMEAQRYPADYDGIIAGAPANFWTHLLSAAAWNVQALSDPASYIPASKLKAIEAAALAACDARDGVVDGVIDEPTKCGFDPSVLLCKGPESDSCLTEPQVAALKKIYAGPRNSQGEQVFPGYLPGSETGPGGWGLWITGAKPGGSLLSFFATQYFRNMVYESASWDPKTFNVDKDVKAADENTARILNATDPDLTAFKSRGGKLILYHGWNDAGIPAQNTINYYQSVVARMGQRDAGQFVRLFLVPGMQHCGDGVGPNSFGQAGASFPADAEHDVSLALERWVEKGVAPDTIVAAKHGADPDPTKGILRTRPLCAYPQVAHWKGIGSTDDAANFVCVMSDSGK